MAKRRIRSDLIAAYLSQILLGSRKQEAKSTECSLINSDFTVVENFWLEKAASKVKSLPLVVFGLQSVTADIMQF